LIVLFVHLEDLICETLELVTVPSLVLSLGVKNADPIQQTFKLSRPGLVLFVAMQLLYISHGEIHLPLIVVTVGSVGLIQVAQLLVLLIFGVEGHVLGQGIVFGNCKHLFGHSGILHGELVDQGRVPESLLKKYDD
jgi:hypothetical protein